MSYQFFRHLCDTLEIRSNSDADRDRELYNQVRNRLVMGDFKPIDFFDQHPEIADAQILVTFLEVLQPFTTMLEFIFSICSRATRGATGGKDFTIRYDVSANALKFDLEAFKRWRTVHSMVTGKATIPRYHSDFVPTYGIKLENISKGELRTWNKPEKSAPPVNVETVREVLERANGVGFAHLQALDNLFNSIRDDANITPEGIEEWRTRYGIEGTYFPSNAQGLRSWHEFMRRGLDALEGIEPDVLVASHPAEELSIALVDLNRALDEISKTRNMKAWQEAVELWLQLPYWKKRWQVYEVWVVANCIGSMLDAGGVLNLNDDNQLVLTSGLSPEPLAHIPFNASSRFELWMQYPLSDSRKAILRPDIAFVYRHRDTLVPIAVIECKQRVAVTEQGMLADARKYLKHMPRKSSHLLVNYDQFKTSALGKSSIYTDQNLRTLKALDNVQPHGQGLSQFIQYVSKTIGEYSRTWFILVDTTGSMHKNLEPVSLHISEIDNYCKGITQFFLVLYGDHNDPYTVQLHATATTSREIAEAVKEAPITEGGDNPEALEDALHFVNEETQRRGIQTDHIVVFTDAPPHLPSECPYSYDYRAEIEQLAAIGCKLTAIACGVDPSELGLDDITIVRKFTFEEHSWEHYLEPR